MNKFNMLETIKIKCRDEIQKNKIMSISNLVNLEIKPTEHKALSRYSEDVETYEKIIIFGVSTEITEGELKQIANVKTVKRLQKKGLHGLNRSDTESVILGFIEDPPTS